MPANNPREAKNRVRRKSPIGTALTGFVGVALGKVNNRCQARFRKSLRCNDLRRIFPVTNFAIPAFLPYLGGVEGPLRGSLEVLPGKVESPPWMEYPRKRASLATRYGLVLQTSAYLDGRAALAALEWCCG